ncbi:MAG TPA: hypothetical protein VMD29_15470 [Terracidiphilus sp.]|jgi:hypothetical protein|nr:hypothetical protein [Terracidiphilus sp.]
MLLLAAILQETQPNFEQAQKMAMAILAIMPFIFIIGLAIVIIPFWFICKKAGFSPWLSFLNIVPFGGIILWYVLAFADWKVVPMAPPVFVPPSPYPPQPPYPPQA